MLYYYVSKGLEKIILSLSTSNVLCALRFPFALIHLYKELAACSIYIYIYIYICVNSKIFLIRSRLQQD